MKIICLHTLMPNSGFCSKISRLLSKTLAQVQRILRKEGSIQTLVYQYIKGASHILHIKAKSRVFSASIGVVMWRFINYRKMLTTKTLYYIDKIPCIRVFFQRGLKKTAVYQHFKTAFRFALACL